jgi:hypothetical protein
MTSEDAYKNEACGFAFDAGMEIARLESQLEAAKQLNDCLVRGVETRDVARRIYLEALDNAARFLSSLRNGEK